METRGPDIRIGEQDYRMAVGDEPFQVVGKHGLEWDWQSLFGAGPFSSRSIPGAPDITGLKPEDLRWELDRFDGGEGQLVFRPSEDGSERRYHSSRGIDLSVPGAPRLARELAQVGSTGAPPTRKEGAADWSTQAGSSTVVNVTDRRLDALASTIKRTLGVLPAGRYVDDLFAYLEGPVVILGSAMTLIAGTGTGEVQGSAFRLHSIGARCQTAALTGLSDGRKVTFEVAAFSSIGNQGPGTVTVKVDVWDADLPGGDVVKSEEIVAHVGTDPVTVDISYGTNPAHHYRYRATLTGKSGTGQAADVMQVEQRTVGPHTILFQVLKAGVPLASSATIDLLGIEASAKVGHLSFLADGASSYELRITSVLGGSRPILDADEIALVGMNTPWVLDLGIKGRLWLVDNDTDNVAPPTVFWWNAATRAWVTVAQFGALPITPVAMTHSDRYGYVLFDDKTVWRFDDTGVTAYTSAIAETAAGLAVTANRLYILGEDATLGTNLYEVPLDRTGGLPLAPASKYQIPDARPSGAPELPRRVASLTAGVIFFVNEASGCRLHIYDVGTQTGAPFMVLQPGFVARAITHMLGTSYVAGQFPGTDADGDTQPRPVVVALDHLSTGTGLFRQLPVRLWRDADAGSAAHDAQLYGTDLYVLVGVRGDVPTMRIWRVDLANMAAFCEHEVALGPEQVNGVARSLALEWSNLAAAWSIGNPYIRAQTYPVGVEQFLYSAVFGNSLLEPKELMSVATDADVPPDTIVRIYYQIDQSGDWNVALEVNSSSVGQFSRVSAPEAPVTYRNLQLALGLTTFDPDVTPLVRLFGARADVAVFDRQYPLVLECLNEEPPPSPKAHGWDLIQNIYALALAGTVVEATLYYAAGPMQEKSAPVIRCKIHDPHAYFVAPGEAYVALTLLEQPDA